MEDSKYAPFPWRWDEDSEVVFDAEGYEVADVYSLELGDGPLLAAAPDLLLACEAALRWLSPLHMECLLYGKNCGQCDADNKLRNALDKAKGTKKL